MTDSWTITIYGPGQWLTANPARAGEWHGRSKLIRAWREGTVWACKAAHLPTGITPVTVDALCLYEGRAPVRDRLNLAPTIKACVDALTPARSFTRSGKTYVTAGYGFLPDDSDKHVLRTDWTLAKTGGSGPPRVELTLTAVA